MSFEELFVGGHILHADDTVIDLEVGDLVDQKERIAVREDLLDGVDIEDHALFPLVLILPDELLLLVQLPDHPGEFDVAGVSRPRCEDLCLQWHADERKVTHQIEQLVPRRLVPEMQGLVVQDAVGAENNGLA